MRDKTVLVVDDEPLMEGMINAILMRHGFRTASFTDAKEALCFFEDHYQIIDLVITDLKMPHIDGTELARKMACVEAKIPVILVTGFIESLPDTETSPNIELVLEKPISKNELVRAVEAVIGPPVPDMQPLP